MATATATVTIHVNGCPSYNCECEGEDPTRKVATLGELGRRLLVRMGYVANADNPPPGKLAEVFDYLQQAQEYLYANVAGFRQSRYYRWPLVQGQRLYGFGAHDDDCKHPQPELVEWVGVSDGPCNEDRWRELAAGINPSLYDGGVRESWPTRYEFRECIEVWPAPDAREGFLRIKARFGIQPFADPEDVTTIDPELIFMLALANMRSDYDKPGADKYMRMVQNRIGEITAGQHHTRRYHPNDVGNLSRATDPVPRDGWLP